MLRINWIDYSKFFGIFLVVIGHFAIPHGAVNFIYLFHMPLFFFISGYLFDRTKFSTFPFFLKHRLKQLIVPYFFFSALTYLFWVFIGRKFGNDAGIGTPAYIPVIGTFYGTDTGFYLIHCGSLWFLPCLLVVELIYYFLCNFKNKLILLTIILILAYMNIKSDHFLLPLSIDAAMVGIIFYFAGNMVRIKYDHIFNFGVGIKWVSVFVSFLFVYFISDLIGRADMSSNRYPDFPLFLIGAITGIYMIISLSQILEKYFNNMQWMTFFAKNTLIILAFHELVASVLKGIAFFVFSIPVENFKDVVILNIVLTLLTFVSIIPVIWILNKYFPVLLGRKR